MDIEEGLTEEQIAHNRQLIRDLYDRADASAEGRLDQWIAERYKDGKLFLVEWREDQWSQPYVSGILGEYPFTAEGRGQAEQTCGRLEKSPVRLREMATALSVRLAENRGKAERGIFVD